MYEIKCFIPFYYFFLNAQNTSQIKNCEVRPKLNIPFGTVVKLDVEIVNGNDFKTKFSQQKFSLKFD